MAHYKYGVVVTTSKKWLDEVINGYKNKGLLVFDFWTNNWIIGKENSIDELHIFYQGNFVIRGKFVNQYKDNPANIFHSRYANKEQIGANVTDNLQDFEEQYIDAFTAEPKKIFGNIEFEVIDIVNSSNDYLSLVSYWKNYDVYELISGNSLSKNKKSRRIVYTN